LRCPRSATTPTILTRTTNRTVWTGARWDEARPLQRLTAPKPIQRIDRMNWRVASDEVFSLNKSSRFVGIATDRQSEWLRGRSSSQACLISVSI
jgi:hypothetical protein